MSKEQLQAGKEWVIQTFMRLADELHVQIEELEWGPDPHDCSQHSLAFKADNERHVEKFTHEKIEDCPNDKNVQAQLESRIRHIVRSPTAPEKKIGY